MSKKKLVWDVIKTLCGTTALCYATYRIGYRLVNDMLHDIWGENMDPRMDISDNIENEV